MAVQSLRLSLWEAFPPVYPLSPLLFHLPALMVLVVVVVFRAVEVEEGAVEAEQAKLVKTSEIR